LREIDARSQAVRNAARESSVETKRSKHRKAHYERKRERGDRLSAKSTVKERSISELYI
jgi:hypothetical protein